MTEQQFELEPIWDSMIAERGGRGPAEFEGHERWDDSDEAREAVERGLAEAAATAVAWLGWDASKAKEWGMPEFPGPDALGVVATDD